MSFISSNVFDSSYSLAVDEFNQLSYDAPRDEVLAKGHAVRMALIDASRRTLDHSSIYAAASQLRGAVANLCGVEMSINLGDFAFNLTA